MNAQPSLSIIVPTIGRTTLARTLASIKSQALLPGDEVLLAVDGPLASVVEAWSDSGLSARLLEVPDGPHGDYGAAARNLAMSQARGDWLLFMDDDDTYLPGSIAVMRAALHGEALHVFRVLFGADGHLQCWRHPQVIYSGNVTTQGIVVRNLPGKVPLWDGTRYDQDYLVAREVAALSGVVWRREVVAHWRPPACRYFEPDGVRPFDDIVGLMELIRSLPPLGAVAEIGCYNGVSTEMWALHSERLLAVDVVLRQGLCERMRFHPHVSLAEAPSVEVAARVPDGSLDLVYIDADHSEAAVRADITAWRPKVKPGGWLTGHDHAPGWPGVIAAVADLLGGPDALFSDSSWLKKV